jgi:hypothetical protein
MVRFEVDKLRQEAVKLLRELKALGLFVEPMNTDRINEFKRREIEISGVGKVNPA